MVTLKYILVIKILFTAFCWAVPALAAPRWVFERLGFPERYPDLFIRLLGAAYLALLVGYLLAVQELCKGIYPAATVWVGIVSNGLACTILAVAAIRRSWLTWGLPARALMWASLGMTFLITAGLLWFGPLGH